MNKPFPLKVILKAGTISLAIFYSIGCGQSVSLPNGFSLQPSDGNTVTLLASDGRAPFQRKLSEFMIHNGFVYGPLPGEPYQYFLLDTSTGKSTIFTQRSELNNSLGNLKLPLFYMNAAMTFWDIKEGYKKADWETSESKESGLAH